MTEPFTALTSSYGFQRAMANLNGRKVRKYLVVLDVDSTMIEQEVIELLAERVGLRDQVKTLTDLAMAGEIDFRDALLQRVGLLKGLSAEVFKELLAEVRVTDGVPELVSAVHKSGGLVGAISGGFVQVLEPLAEKLNLDFFKANNLEISDGVITGMIVGDIIDAEMKARTLLQWTEECGFDSDNTVAVGDGANDIQMLKASGFAVAFRPKDILRDHADLIIEGDSLEPLISVLELRSS
jgi:phosphoserine phosphatase